MCIPRTLPVSSSPSSPRPAPPPSSPRLNNSLPEDTDNPLKDITTMSQALPGIRPPRSSSLPKTPSSIPPIVNETPSTSPLPRPSNVVK